MGTPPSVLGSYPSRGRLDLDDVRLGTLYERNYLVTLSLGNLERIEGGVEVPNESRPITLADSHALVRGIHVPPGVIHGPACARAEKVDEELLLSGDAILSPMVPEAPQPRIRLEAGQQIVGDG
jgi:hypothetical protein